MNFRKILRVAVYEFRTNFRRWGYRIATFGLPLLGAILLVAAQALMHHADIGKLVMGNLNKPIAVYDGAGLLPHGTRLPKPFIRAVNLEAAKSDLRAGKLLGVVVIPSDYEDTYRVTVYASSGIAASDAARRELHEFLLYAALSKKLSPEEARRLSKGPDIDIVVMGGHGYKWEGSSRVIVGYGLSILFFIVLFTSSGYLLQSVAKEKESHVMELLLSSLTSLELLWGKVLGLGALGVTQAAVWVASLWLLSDRAGRLFSVARAVSAALTHLDSQWIVAIASVLPLSYLTYGVLMAGLGSMGSNSRESQQFTAAVSLLAAFPFMVNFLFTLNPNGLIPRALSYFPITAPSAVLLRLAFAPVPWWDMGIVVLMMALGAATSIWVGVRLFRVGVLMTGKKPSWREVVQILRNPA